MARSNKNDADQAGPPQPPSDANQTEWHGPSSRSHTLERRRGRIGTALLIELPNRAAADRFWNEEPFARNGGYQRDVRITRWHAEWSHGRPPPKPLD
jgi:hypothetical protein